MATWATPLLPPADPAEERRPLSGDRPSVVMPSAVAAWPEAGWTQHEAGGGESDMVEAREGERRGSGSLVTARTGTPERRSYCRLPSTTCLQRGMRQCANVT